MVIILKLTKEKKCTAEIKIDKIKDKSNKYEWKEKSTDIVWCVLRYATLPFSQRVTTKILQIFISAVEVFR